MELVENRPNVELRKGAEGEPIVVLSFPYDAHIVAVVRTIPHRRFDWDAREWWAPVDDWAGVHVAEVLEQDAARLDSGAQRCVSSLDRGEAPAPSRLAVSDTVDGVFLRLEVLWDRDALAAFSALPGAGDNSQALPSDPWIVEPLDAFIALHQVSVDGHAARVLAGLRAQHDEAIEQIRASKADSAPPIPAAEAALGGELAPFQWAGVRYALDARRCFLADEQGLGKTVEALACLEADDAYPAIVVCPASLKLNWEREAARWL